MNIYIIFYNFIYEIYKITDIYNLERDRILVNMSDVNNIEHIEEMLEHIDGKEEAPVKLENENEVSFDKQNQNEDEIIKSIAYKAQLELKDKKIGSLKKMIADVKAEIMVLETRNEQICNILSQQYQEQAEAVLKIKYLLCIQDSLMAEIQSLHEQLEQEKLKIL